MISIIATRGRKEAGPQLKWVCPPEQKQRTAKKAVPALPSQKLLIGRPLPPRRVDTAQQPCRANAACLRRYRCSHPRTDAENRQCALPGPSPPPALSSPYKEDDAGRPA